MSEAQTGTTGEQISSSSVTFRQLAEGFLRQRPPLMPKNYVEMGLEPMMDFYFAHISQDNGPFIPALRVDFDPPLSGRMQQRIKLFGVSSSQTDAVYEDLRGNLQGVRPTTFDVYDMDLSKLRDPGVIQDVKQIEADKVIVPQDSKEAVEIGSWVVDPQVRQKIQEYSSLLRHHVDRYVWLRNAATEQKSNPGFGKFTYSDIKKQAAGDDFFKPADLEWLQEFMKNKGLPIPE